MTNLGKYLDEKFINRADVVRQTGISASRMFSICQHESARLTVDEFYKICLALKLDPTEFIQIICEHIKLPE